MKVTVRSLAVWLVVLGLSLLALPGFSQVPQDMTFTGRLVDNLGNPLAGPVDLELRIFDAETAGTELYSEQHLGTSLDATGGFSVQLGLGTSPSSTLDAALFSGVDRWLEVVVGVEVLTPRQVLGSVPWALIAQQVAPWDPNATPRFEDCGDGTVADHQTGLQWEKKTGTPGSFVNCDLTPCPDAHDVNNTYGWSVTGPDPDGGAFIDFLGRLNATFDPVNPTGCFAGHCDWALPEISELQTLLVGPNAAPGQSTTCSSAPCIDPDFAALDGPIALSGPFGLGWYWSGSKRADGANSAWVADFANGSVANSSTTTPDGWYVRSVRAGSCSQ